MSSAICQHDGPVKFKNIELHVMSKSRLKRVPELGTGFAHARALAVAGCCRERMSSSFPGTRLQNSLSVAVCGYKASRGCFLRVCLVLRMAPCCTSPGQLTRLRGLKPSRLAPRPRRSSASAREAREDVPDLEKLLEELDQSSGPESVHVQSAQSKESKERKGDAFFAVCILVCFVPRSLAHPAPRRFLTRTWSSLQSQPAKTRVGAGQNRSPTGPSISRAWPRRPGGPHT